MSRIRRLLCKRSDIADGAARGFELMDEAHRRDVVLVSREGRLYAYINSCPHRHLPLEIFPDRFLNEDGSLLICSAHGARFRVEDGLCTSGPCQGQSLKVADVEIDDGDVYLVI
jgi:nitrite reductase/ring-hydroxylating ferredoxin subunit